MKTTPNIRRSIIALTFLALAAPIVLIGSIRSMQRVENAPAFWLPKSFPQRRLFDQFVRDFNCLDTLLVSWDGCTVDDTRLETFRNILLSDRRTKNGLQYKELFAEVLTGYEAVCQMTAPPLALSREQAIERLKGSLVGRDGHTSCAAVALTKQGGADRQLTIDTIIAAAQEATGLDVEQIHLTGSVVDGAAIDAESIRSMSQFALPSAVLSLALCWYCLRSAPLTAGILAVGAFGEGLVLAMVYFCGITMNAVLAVMAPLVFVLTISAGVHLSNYFFDEARQHGPSRAADRAIQIGWQPCWLAAITTAVGMISLLASRIIPVRQFGVFSAVGVLVTTALLFLLLPGIMDLVASRRWFPSTSKQHARSNPPTQKTLWRLLSVVTVDHWPAVVLVFAIVMVWTGLGLAKVRTSVAVRNLLVENSKTLRDYHWFESNIGPLVPVEVIVNFDQDCRLDVLDRIQLVRGVMSALAKIPELGGVASAATFLPDVPPPGGARQTARRAVVRRLLQERYQQLIASHWIANTGTAEKWRISARVPALTDTDYGIFLTQIDKQVSTILSSVNTPGVSAVYTGLTPLVYKAQRALLEGMFYSFLTALVFVSLMMMAVQRSLGAGLLAMLPNVFPAILVFGVMGWSDTKVDIGSVMTASVALGIAVDGTVHYLTWYRRELQAGLPRKDAARWAYGHCAWAMSQTTLICSLGMLIFAASNFIPTCRFAWMMFALLVAALVGDLVLLPSLLVSPLGKLVTARARQ